MHAISNGLAAPWYVAAGWALDLFLGRQTREHDDLEIGVPARRFAEVREALAGFELVVVGGGQCVADDGVDARGAIIRPGCESQTAAPGAWTSSASRGTETSGRADATAASGSRPRDSSRARADGIPYAPPEVVLLFKAKATRPKDERDFATLLPHLDADRRSWLRDALELVHPEHPWLEALATR